MDKFAIRSLSLLVIVIVLSFFFLLGNEIITHFIQIYMCVCVCRDFKMQSVDSHNSMKECNQKILENKTFKTKIYEIRTKKGFK